MLKKLFEAAKAWWQGAGFESVGFLAAFFALGALGKGTLATAAITIFIYVNVKVIWGFIVEGAKALWTKEK